jgi:ferritin
MISEKMLDLLNTQLRMELDAAYYYMAAAAWCENNDWSGAAHFMRLQSREENEHAMKLFDYMLERKAQVSLQAIEAPHAEYDSLLAAMRDALEHEQAVTKSVYSLLDQAYADRDYMTVNLLNWFVGEQAEEESLMDGFVVQLERAGDSLAAQLLIDRDLGARSAGAGETALG